MPDIFSSKVHIRVLILSALLFLGVALWGIFSSARLPLWLDEHVSLQTVTSLSYDTLISGRYTRESNNSPLFYLTQKGLLDAAGYREEYFDIIDMPGRPHPFERYWHDPLGNSLVRFVPVIMMALSLALLFYYFALRDGFGWGVLAVLLSASYPWFWYHGFEARPYIHFYAMTTAQFLILTDMLRAKRISSTHWRLLGAVHLLLALTFTTSAVQIGAVLVGLLCWRRSMLNPKILLIVFALPLAVIAYYYLLALKLTYFFDRGLMAYVVGNVTIEALIAAIAALGAGIYMWYKKKAVEHDLSLVGLFALTLAAYIAAMFFVAYQAAGEGSHLFYQRYLFQLAAVGVIMTVVFCRQLWVILSVGWPKYLLIAVLSVFLLTRYYELWLKMTAWGRYQWMG